LLNNKFILFRGVRHYSYLTSSFNGHGHLFLVVATKPCFFSSLYFIKTGNKTKQQFSVFKINIVNVFLAKITHDFMSGANKIIQLSYAFVSYTLGIRKRGSFILINFKKEYREHLFRLRRFLQMKLFFAPLLCRLMMNLYRHTKYCLLAGYNFHQLLVFLHFFVH